MHIRILSFILLLFCFSSTFAEDILLKSKSVDTSMFRDEVIFENYSQYSDEELYIFLYINEVHLPISIETNQDFIKFFYDNIDIDFAEKYTESQIDDLFIIEPLLSKNFEVDITRIVDDYNGRDFIVVVEPYVKRWDTYMSIGSGNIHTYFLSDHGKYLYFTIHTFYRSENHSQKKIEIDNNFRSKISLILSKLTLDERYIFQKNLQLKINAYKNKLIAKYKTFLRENIDTEDSIMNHKNTIKKYNTSLELIWDISVLIDMIDPETGWIKKHEVDIFFDEIIDGFESNKDLK